MKMSLRLKASLLFLILAFVYLALPEDILPFSFFDDIFVLAVAFTIWIVLVVIETGKTEERKEVII